MKTLNFEQMHTTNGGNFMDGACAVVGFTDVGLGVKFMLKQTVKFAIPYAGQALAIAGIACFGYSIFK